MPGSIHLRLVGEWLAEVDHETSKDDLVLWGFAFDDHHMEFEALDSKIVRRNRGDHPRRIQEKDGSV